MGIEPTFEAWEAPVLPLNYTRDISARHSCRVPIATYKRLHRQGSMMVIDAAAIRSVGSADGNHN